MRDKRLPTKAGVHRHQQHNVELVHDVLQHLQRGGGIQHQTGFAATFFNQPKGAVNVLAGFGVKGDDVGTGFGKHRNQAINRLHHQMHVNRGGGVRANGFADQGADGQVGDVMVVHHIKMDDVGTSGNDVADFFTQAGKVSGKQARCQFKVGQCHGGLGNRIKIGGIAR